MLELITKLGKSALFHTRTSSKLGPLTWNDPNTVLWVEIGVLYCFIALLMNLDFQTPLEVIPDGITLLNTFWAHLCNLHGGLICIAFHLSVCLSLAFLPWNASSLYIRGWRAWRLPITMGTGGKCAIFVRSNIWWQVGLIANIKLHFLIIKYSGYPRANFQESGGRQEKRKENGPKNGLCQGG